VLLLAHLLVHLLYGGFLVVVSSKRRF